MSTVFYRWGAGRDESRVTFDGTHISVFDLKREIILTNKMGNGKDFDLSIYDNVTGEEFKDDNHQIPRSSSLVARRLPSSAKGRGNAQNYIIGTAAGDALTGDHRIEAHARDAMQAKQNRGLRGTAGTYQSLTRRFDGKEEKKSDQPAVAFTTGNAEEDARIQAMMQQEADQWQQNLEDLPQQRGGNQFRPRPKTGAAPSGGKFDYSLPPDKEPPVGYICYRCGQKGHWIQNCPKNEDPAAAETKRFVRVTGIPRSFLKTVETPSTGEGSSGGAMLTADGGFVRAVPDQRAWQKQAAAKPRALTGADVRDQQPLDGALSCPICKKLVWEAVRTPCCDVAYCEECIQTNLLEHAFECPSCESKVASLDKLKEDPDLRAKVKTYVEGEIERSKKSEEEEDGSRTPVKSEEGSVPPSTLPTSETDGQAPNIPAAVPTIPGMDFDPARMQEMLNPHTMQAYMTQVHKMLQNPQLAPQARVLLQTQMQAVNASVMQMQLLAASGMAMGMGGQNSMAIQNGMNMGNGMGNGVGNGMGSGMGMGMSMPGRGRGFQARPFGFNNRGRGMGRGMGMSTGGMGVVRPGMKRPAEETGLEVAAGGEKQPRM